MANEHLSSDDPTKSSTINIDYTGPKRVIQVFIASPSDVATERGSVRTVINRLNMQPLLNNLFELRPVAWDQPGARMSMHAALNPQENIERKIKPSECDIVVVIFWARMGLPLPADRVKPEEYRYLRNTEWEPRYLSGTEYEFVDAMQSTLAHGKPIVMVYRKTEKVLLDPDADDFEEKLIQKQRINAFFKQFNYPDGSARWSYYPYPTPDKFELWFEQHLLQEVKSLLESSKQEQLSTADTDTAVHKWDQSRSPFPGLRAFEPEDALVFFGRRVETEALIKRLTEQRFVAVVAASGSGKSSLVRAGLIPQLAHGVIPGVKGWHVVTVKPGSTGPDPFQSLAGALIRSFPNLTLENGNSSTWSQDGLAATLKNEPYKVVSICHDALVSEEPGDEILLFVDQFEELFSVVSESIREPFAQALNALAQYDRIRTVITLRADFYERCLTLQPLKPLLEPGTFPLYPPGPGQLYDMITKPAAIAGLTFEEGLDWAILEDTGNEPGALALVAYTLEQLWQNRTAEGALTWDVYISFGSDHVSGVEGAIGAQAELAYCKLYDELGEAAWLALQTVFRDLIEVNPQTGVATRRRAPLQRLLADENCRALIHALVEARLLITSRDESAGQTVEVAHEAIFRSWPMLVNWIEKTQEDLILLRQLTNAAHEWVLLPEEPAQQRKQKAAFRWPHERLVLVYEMLERFNQPSLDQAVREFIRPEVELLLEEIEDLDIPHFRRATISNRLNEVGDCDYREGTGLIADVDQPDISWLTVPGGQIAIKGQDFTVHSFRIAKYPLTYCQYQLFIESDDGYANPAWWQGLPTTATYPGVQNRPLNNHPAEMVSWYDAIAYCRWLNARLGLPDLPADLTSSTLGICDSIRLPAEWEWEWAAKGGTLNNSYPWGLDWDELKANTSESGLSRSTAVGMYPAGAAACGALDMSGNVAEWCLNEYDRLDSLTLTTPERRTIRGGDWGHTAQSARSNSRNNLQPDSRSHYVGFRLVISPG